MAVKGEDGDRVERMAILEGHTATITAVHTDWAAGVILSASLVTGTDGP